MDDLRRNEAPGVDQPLAEPEESLGGEPACWAHLFEDQFEAEAFANSALPFSTVLNAPESAPENFFVIDAIEVARGPQLRGPVRSRRSEDLDINVLVFRAGEGIAEHVNTAVDVLLVAVNGEGMLWLDGQPTSLRNGQLVLIPKGTRRRIQAVSDRFAYVTCHRSRPGLLPVPKHDG
jgi:quercetin dioxygenase-like cupin family protein